MTEAKINKENEFYTQLSDIEQELKHYKDQFKDKVVFCNCDDPYESNFFKYFAINFNYLGLKKLIATLSLPPYFCIRVVNPYHYIHNKVPCCKFLNCIGLIFSLTTILLLL